MPLLDPPATDRLAPETRDQLDAWNDRHGHFAGVRAVFSHFPAGLKALDNQYDLMMGQGRLPRWLREVIFAGASHTRGDEYLAGALVAEIARHRGRTIAEARAMAVDGTGLDTAQAALLTWARKMAATPYKSVARDAEHLHELGWTNNDIVEALTIVSLSAYLNIMSLALKLR